MQQENLKLSYTYVNMSFSAGLYSEVPKALLTRLLKS